MAVLGYEYLRHTLRLSAFPVEWPALLKPVTRVKQTDAFLSIPKHVALSKNRRKQFGGRVPEDVFDFIEHCAKVTSAHQNADVVTFQRNEAT